jgi:hypothetical protein
MRRTVPAVAAVALASLLAPALAAAWPSLDKQLETDRIRPGTALAALVAANQDFRLLRPEEAQDKLPLPPWLRVLWHKQHPASRYRPGDRTGGYPLVLREAHEWMLSHQDLKPGLPPPAAPPGRSAVAGSNLRISGVQNEPRSESAIRINPFHPTQIISASNNILFGGGQAEYYSSDGGATWGQTSLALLPQDAFQSDPTVDWTSDGTAWSITIGIDAFVSNLQLRAYKSTDGGATWTYDSTISGDQFFTDKEMIWVDHSNFSPFRDNLYVIWHNGYQVYVTRRTGADGVWQPPLLVSGAETIGTGIGGDITSNAAGVVFASWPDTGSQGIFVARSTDGGASFSTPVKIATTSGSFDIGIPADDFRRVLIYTSTGTSEGPTHDNVYATWNDLNGAAGCNAWFDEPGFDTTSTCTTRIWFARSSDGGSTWSIPMMINNQPSLNDQFFPWLAVDPTTGAIGVTYYDTVANPDRVHTDVWYQSSFDRGSTWSAPLKITTAETDETAYTADSGNQYGDYTGLSAFAGQLFPSWTDRRYGKSEEIWTAAINDPACTAPGAPVAGTASTPGAHQVQVSWSNGAPASSKFNVYRALGTCASHAAFGPVASGLSSAPYLDGTVSGSLTYAYQVTGLDATGNCESLPSGCMQAAATGTCTVPPTFAGVAHVAGEAAATCAIDLSWPAAAAPCGGAVSYNVYRSTAPGFTPALANRVAAGLATTSYADSSPLAVGVTYYYVVRAVDASNGAEDGNTVTLSAAPGGQVAFLDTFEGSASGGGFDHPGWTHTALSGGVDWALSTSHFQSPTHSWFSAEQSTASDRVLTTPTFAATAGSLLHFWHTYAFEGDTFTCYDGGTLEASVNGGPWNTVPFNNFLAGPYNGFINTGYNNPLGGALGWCGGTLGPMTEVIVDLTSYAGSNVQLRWHEGDDDSNAIAGWYVDTVSLVASCQTASPPPLNFYTVTPCRMVDTRGPTGATGGPALQPISVRTFQLAGLCGVPAGAKALALNLTVTQGTTPGVVTIYQANQLPPATTTLVYAAGQTRANNAVTALASDTSGLAAVRLSASGTVQLIIDVVGYFQ